MSPDALLVLKEVGADLDRDRYPIVHDGGVIEPAHAIVSTNELGLEIKNEQSKPARPESRPWQRTEGWQRPSLRSWPPRSSAPFICPVLRERFASDVNKLSACYPETTVRECEYGAWLNVPSEVLLGLEKRARFILFIPFMFGYKPKAWGFWQQGLAFSWIGPRHTNFPDGSICAFDPRDEIWDVEDGLVSLVDLFTVWAFRHAHLEVLKRWPGRQSVWHPYERILEFNDDEICGCDRPSGRYARCCKPKDLDLDKIDLAADFLKKFGFGLRRAPGKLNAFLYDKSSIPCPSIAFPELNMNQQRSPRHVAA